MAVHALTPAPSPANTDRTAFNLALGRFASATAARIALAGRTPPNGGHAAVSLDHARLVLTETPSPDAAALVTKLRIALDGSNVPAIIVDRLIADVRLLARGEALA